MPREIGTAENAGSKPENTLNTYQVFPGIQLIFCNIHTQSITPKEKKSGAGRFLEISHCREGRLEWDLHGEFFYLAAGDLAVAQTNDLFASAYFPLCHYHGAVICIDMDHTPQCLSCLLEDVNVEPQELAKKFCMDRPAFIARSNRSVEHIFSELYFVPEEIQKGYFKIKVLELLLFLSVLDIGQDEFPYRRYSQIQANWAREIGRYLMEHMEARITVKQIAEYFDKSETYIKNMFKNVYGVSPYAFIREQKMESAAYMLECTDKSILEIANTHGYDNASKFAGAFREVKGLTPNEYRARTKEKFSPNAEMEH